MTAAEKHNVNDVTTDEALNRYIQASSSRLTLLNFWASWHEPCIDMNTVFEELSRKYPSFVFVRLEAEEFPDVSESFEISSVPTFILLRNAKPIERVEGANPPALTSLLEKYLSASTTMIPSSLSQPTSTNGTESPEKAQEKLEARLKALIASQPVMIFMKGTPSEPRCGFSRQAIEILTNLGCAYGSFNILADSDVREGLKKFSNWPTYPQFYVNGELIGGLDIVKEMIESGELQKILPKEEDLNTRLSKLVSRSPVMVFIKGTPETPRCGFSRQIIALLDENNVTYDTFDILEDDDVRQGLKTFSNWPTFPQLYVKGELVGGLDIVRELIESGEFSDMLPK